MHQLRVEDKSSEIDAMPKILNIIKGQIEKDIETRATCLENLNVDFSN